MDKYIRKRVKHDSSFVFDALTTAIVYNNRDEFIALLNEDAVLSPSTHLLTLLLHDARVMIKLAWVYGHNIESRNSAVIAASLGYMKLAAQLEWIAYCELVILIWNHKESPYARLAVHWMKNVLSYLI